MPFVATWMDLEIIIFSEVSQTEKHKYHTIALIWLPRWLSDKEFACQCWRPRFDPWIGKIPWFGASLVAQSVKYLPAMQETQALSLDWEDPLEKEITSHFSILAWDIPWGEETGGLQSMGLQELDTTERLNHHHQESGTRQLKTTPIAQAC